MGPTRGPGGQIGPAKHRSDRGFRENELLAAKSGPRGPTRGPGGPKSEPREVWSGPRSVQERPKSRQERTKSRPGPPQEQPQRGQERPKRPEAAPEAPRRTNLGRLGANFSQLGDVLGRPTVLFPLPTRFASRHAGKACCPGPRGRPLLLNSRISTATDSRSIEKY